MSTNNPEQIIEKHFNENFRSLVFSSFRIVKDYEQAEDIVQNVFVKIWQNFDKIQHHKNLKAYIATTVKNSSINFLRDQKPDTKNTVSVETSNLEISEENDAEVDKNKLITSVHQAVDNLPENWREAFILSKYEKLKYYEIATKMGVSDKTVEKYISKALKTLRSELKHLLRLIAIFFLNEV